MSEKRVLDQRGTEFSRPNDRFVGGDRGDVVSLLVVVVLVLYVVSQVLGVIVLVLGERLG